MKEAIKVWAQLLGLVVIFGIIITLVVLSIAEPILKAWALIKYIAS